MGNSALLTILGGIALGTVIGAIAGGITALATGEDVWAGMAGGAVSGFISTTGMAFAIATSGWGGLAIAAGAGYASGFAGSVVQQGISDGWDKIDYESAHVSGTISMATNLIAYGTSNFAMQESVGLFEDVFDKGLSYLARVGNAVSISVESAMVTVMFSVPCTVLNIFGEALAAKLTSAQDVSDSVSNFQPAY